MSPPRSSEPAPTRWPAPAPRQHPPAPVTSVSSVSPVGGDRERGGSNESDGGAGADRDRAGAGPSERGVIPGADGAGRPVALDVDPAHEDGLRRWVEGVLGWQVVDQLTAGLVPPTVHLVGPDARPPDGTIPRVLVVDDQADGAVVMAAYHRLRPAAGVTWPRDRDRLEAVVDEVVAVPSEPHHERQVLRVGGVAGGVGTTTVVLALAGLSGWQGRSTLAAVRGDVPAGDLPVVASEALAATDLWSRLGPLDGVPSTRAMRVGDPGPLADPRDPTVDLAVLDHGVDTDADIVVCRMDAAALEGLPATAAAAIVVVGSGPLRPKALREATGGRPTLLLPWSTRVARAGLRRRVPGSLPGAWLRRLLPLLPPLPGTGAIGSAGRRAPPASSDAREPRSA